MVRGPIEIVRIIVSIVNGLFEGFNVLKNLLKVCIKLKVVKMYVFWSIRKRAGQNGSTAPPGTQPIGFHITNFHKNRETGVS